MFAFPQGTGVIQPDPNSAPGELEMGSDLGVSSGGNANSRE